MEQQENPLRRGLQRFPTLLLVFLLTTTALAACGGITNPTQNNDGIHKIKHIIVIMQENRSFDTYFGTYPGADGIPMQKDAS